MPTDKEIKDSFKKFQENKLKLVFDKRVLNDYDMVKTDVQNAETPSIASTTKDKKAKSKLKYI